VSAFFSWPALGSSPDKGARHEPDGPELVAVFLRGLEPEKCPPQDCWVTVEPPCENIAWPGSLSRRPSVARRIPNARTLTLPITRANAEVVDAVMREEMLVFRGQDRVPRAIGGMSSYGVICRYSRASSMSGSPLASWM